MSDKLDLTQIMYQGMPDWDGSCGFQMKQVLDYDDGVCVQEFATPNGIGTHMDAPSHFIPDASDISSIPLEKLMCPGLMIDVSHKANETYLLSVDDVFTFEKTHGTIPEKSILIINTGWWKKWDDAEAYRNVNADGHMRFPTISKEAAELLLERNINGIGIDTLSPDLPDSDFPVHKCLLGANKIIIENIRVVEELPPKSFTLVALPLKIHSATEAPCRVIAII